MKKITCICIVLISTMLYSQEKEVTYNKWLFKLGANIVDNSGDTNPFNGLDLEKMGFSQNYAGGVDYRFHRHWSVGAFVSNNRFVANRAELDSQIITEDKTYFATDVNVKYYLWGAEYENISSNRFNMYLTLGVGSFKITNNTFSANVGGGLIYWLNDSFGVNVESMAKWSLNGDTQFDTNHFQHFLGITYRHNAKKDTDKDGVLDEDDKCPKTFGLKEFNGCPDSDGDGITDAEDHCPNAAGLKKYNGCPDTDNDGVINSQDKCPNTFGPKENGGCPYKDSDSDGVYDKFDKCPNESGSKNNNGCPVEEIKEDKEPIEETNKKLETLSKAIYFETGKSNFKIGTTSILNKIVASLKKYSNAKVSIEGHTDNTGSSTANLKLSQRRAEAVKNYLIRNGIARENITAIGFGQDKPEYSNTTKEGRALNRRVIIKIN